MRFSASMIRTYMQCPLQARFHYVDKLPDERVNAKTVYGSVMHKVLEFYNQSGKVNDAVKLFKGLWADPERLGYDSTQFTWPKFTTFGSLMESGIEALRWYDEKNKWENRKILGTEVEFTVPLGEHELHGFIDLLEYKKSNRGVPTLRVVDYKTAGRLPSKTKLFLDVQFTSYVYATLQPEFWAPLGQDLFEKFEKSPRRAIWCALTQRKEIDVGPRDDRDFMRLYRVANMIETAIDKEVFIPVISEDSCTFCFAGETRILTSEGTQEIGSLVGRDVEVMTRYGKWVVAPIRSFGVAPLVKLTLTRNGVQKIVHATANHRWFVKDGESGERVVETKNLSKNSRLVSTWGQGVRGKTSPSAYGIAHGLVFGDGNLVRHGAQGAAISLYGEKNKDLLKWFPLSPFRVEENRDRITVRDLPGYFKRQPSLSESRSYLYGFMAGYFAADGTVGSTGQVTISSARYEDLQMVRDVCTRIGIGTYGIQTQLRKGTGEWETPLYTLGIIRHHLTEEFFLVKEHRERWLVHGQRKRDALWTVVSVQPTDRVEEVFCATVPETAAFVLEDNILTGNCPYTENCCLEIPPREVLMGHNDDDDEAAFT